MTMAFGCMVFILVLTASSLLAAGSVSAQTLKPVVTEFWLQYVDNSYDVAPSATSTKDLYTGEVTTSTIPGYRVENRSIVVTIKNPPDVDAYNFRWKDHNNEIWYYEPFNPDKPLPLRVYDSCGIAAYASSSEYTELSLLFIPKTSTWIDIQMQALYGDYRANPYVHIAFPIDCPTYDFYFDGQASYWSNTQTITIGSGEVTGTEPTPSQSSANPTASSSAPLTQGSTVIPIQPNTQTSSVLGFDWEKAAIVGLVVVVAVLAVGLVALWRRMPKK
jgi:hypothetical protein